ASRRTWLRRSALLLLICGIAGPRWGIAEEDSALRGRDLILVLDMSRSMLCQDVLPNRLARAITALDDLTRDVQRRGGHRLGLVIFAGRARLVCPLTPDYQYVRNVLAELDPITEASTLRGIPGEDEPP